MIAFITIILLVAADQATKYMALKYLEPIGSIPIIDGFLSLTYVENRGAAFGIFQGQRWVFIILTITVLSFMFYYYRSLTDEKPFRYMKMTLVLIASGAVGNFIDRIFRGFVVDFFQFTFFDFPVFNVADCFVCIGTVLLMIIILFFVKD